MEITKKINSKNLNERSFTNAELLILLKKLSLTVDLYSYSRVLDLVEELTGERENKEIKKFKVRTKTKPILGNIISTSKEVYAFEKNDIISDSRVSNHTITFIEEIKE